MNRSEGETGNTGERKGVNPRGGGITGLSIQNFEVEIGAKSTDKETSYIISKGNTGILYRWGGMHLTGLRMNYQ